MHICARVCVCVGLALRFTMKRVEGITITFILRGGIMKELSRGKVLFLRDEIMMRVEFEVVIEDLPCKSWQHLGQM